MSLNSDSETTTAVTAERLVGCVKWFNNKAGYGFITVSEGSRTGTDVFIHHSSINVRNQQYKYLVQGEYVEFSVVPTNGGTHEFQASNVSGIKNGKLMCETRFDTKLERNRSPLNVGEESQQQQQQKEPEVKLPRTRKPPQQTLDSTDTPKVRGEGPRNGNEWTQVKRGTASREPRQKKVPQ